MSRPARAAAVLAAIATTLGVIAMIRCRAASPAATTSAAPPAATAAPAQPTQAAARAGDPCPHPFVSVGAGSRWHYRFRAGSHVVDTTLDVASVDVEGRGWEVLYRAAVNGVEREYSQRCAADRADEPWSLATAANELSVGPSWQVLASYDAVEVQRATFEGSRIDPATRAEAPERYTGERTIRAVGRELVEVAAGRFDALHIAFEERWINGVGRPTRAVDQWLVEGVGLVRSTVRSSLDPSLVAEQELIDFQGPS